MATKENLKKDQRFGKESITSEKIDKENMARVSQQYPKNLTRGEIFKLVSDIHFDCLKKGRRLTNIGEFYWKMIDDRNLRKIVKEE